MKEEFIKTIKEWYGYISKDHHKDKDCHFFIGEQTEYRYDGEELPKVWTARHDGYITEFDFEGISENDVMGQVIKHLKGEMAVKNIEEDN